MQEQDLEARRHPAGWSGEALAIYLRRFQQSGAVRHAAAAFEDEIALAHGAEVAHQDKRAFVVDLDRLAIGHRQRQTGTLEEAGGVAQIGERRDPGAEAALDLAFGRRQGLAKLPQGFPSQHGAEKQTVRLQDPADLDQRARQIVHPVKRHRTQHQVEGSGRKGQRFLVGDHGWTTRAAGEGEAEIAANEMGDGRPPAERRCDLVAVTAKIERQGEVAAHVIQPFDQSLGDLALEKSLAVPVTRGSVAAMAKHRAVEDQKGIGGGHGRM